MIKWIKGDYDYPKRYARKGEIGKLDCHKKAVRVCFRFEIAWIVINSENKVLMENGSWMPTWSFYLLANDHVIGPQDMSVADNTPLREAWRNAAVDLRRDQMIQLDAPRI
jgi:hypothetical protein